MDVKEDEVDGEEETQKTKGTKKAERSARWCCPQGPEVMGPLFTAIEIDGVDQMICFLLPVFLYFFLIEGTFCGILEIVLIPGKL